MISSICLSVALSFFFSSLLGASLPLNSSFSRIGFVSGSYFLLMSFSAFSASDFHCSASSSVNFLKNAKPCFTVAPQAVNTSGGIVVISKILALLSAKSLTFCRLGRLNASSDNTTPILPPGFNKFKQRSINKTSVNALMLPVSYKSNKGLSILSFTCFNASSYALPYLLRYFFIFSISAYLSASVIFNDFSTLLPNGGFVRIISKRFSNVPFPFKSPLWGCMPPTPPPCIIIFIFAVRLIRGLESAPKMQSSLSPLILLFGLWRSNSALSSENKWRTVSSMSAFSLSLCFSYVSPPPSSLIFSLAKCISFSILAFTY